MKKIFYTFLVTFLLILLNLSSFTQQSSKGQAKIDLSTDLSRTEGREALAKVDSLENLLKTAKEDTTKVNILCQLSHEYLNKNPGKALEYGKQGLTLGKKLKFNQGIAHCLNTIGNVHRIKGDYQKALNFYLQALKIEEESNNSLRIAKIHNNIGAVYFYQEDFTKTIDYFHKSLKVLEQLGDKKSMAASFNNIGAVYNIQKKHKKALEYFFRAYEIAKKINDKKGISVYLTSIGGVYIEFEDYDKALEYLLKALIIKEELNAKKSILYNYSAIGQLYLRRQQYEYAIEYYNMTLKLSRELNIKEGIKSAYDGFSKIYANKGDYKKAYEYYQLYSEIKDSLFNEEGSKQIAEMQTKYETEKKEKRIELLQKDKELQATELKKNRIMLLSFAGGFLLVLVFSFLLYNRFRVIRKQKNIIQEQKTIVDEKNKDITESIRYAKSIQSAILPEEEQLKDFFPESFIYFKPKDIVSGDFYFFSEVRGNIIITVCDCTGHGVPGALMSMIGNSLLNEIVNDKSITKAGEVLNQLKEGVIKALGQTGISGETSDGMDMAFCCLTPQPPLRRRGRAQPHKSPSYTLQYAGAYNPLYIVRQGIVNSNFSLNQNIKFYEDNLAEIKADLSAVTEGVKNEKHILYEVKADRQPIAYLEGKNKPFTTNEIQLKKGDTIYIFSDGYTDQFGGPENKKFSSKQFKDLLLSIQDKLMEEQREILDKTIEDWKGDGEQIDDICVVGVRV